MTVSTRLPVAVARAAAATGRWLAGVAALLAATVVGVSGLLYLMPGDPAFTLLSTQLGRVPSEAEVAAKRAELGLDRPWADRVLDRVGDLLHGRLGRSWATPGDVADLLGPRLRATVTLALLALAMAVLLGLAFGIGAAVLRGTWADAVLRLVVGVFAAVPAFVLGILVLQFVVLDLGIGRVLADGTLRSALFPAFLLAVGTAAAWVRPVRAMALDALDSPVVTVARAHGTGPWRVLGLHVLPRVALDFLPFLGLALGSILGATAVMEVVFAWPGAGSYATQAALRRDLPVLEAVVLLSVLAFRLGNDAMRMLAWLADPRRRTGTA